MNYRIIPQKHFLKEIKRLGKKYRSTVDETEGIINLIFIYDKEERDSISKTEIDRLLQELPRIPRK